MLSSFDIDTHARTQRENMMRDAEMARKVHIASAIGRVHRPSLWQPVARLMATAQCWLAARRAGADDARSTKSAVSPHRQSYPSLEPAPRAHYRRPARTGDPYAGMILVARASSVPVAEQPCSVGDR